MFYKIVLSYRFYVAQVLFQVLFLIFFFFLIFKHKFQICCSNVRNSTKNYIINITTVLSTQVSPAVRRPVMATADTPGPDSAADLKPFRGAWESLSLTGFLSVWSCFEVLHIKCYFCISTISVIQLSIKCDFCFTASL